MISLFSSTSFLSSFTFYTSLLLSIYPLPLKPFFYFIFFILALSCHSSSIYVADSILSQCAISDQLRQTERTHLSSFHKHDKYSTPVFVADGSQGWDLMKLSSNSDYFLIKGVSDGPMTTLMNACLWLWGKKKKKQNNNHSDDGCKDDNHRLSKRAFSSPSGDRSVGILNDLFLFKRNSKSNLTGNLKYVCISCKDIFNLV